MRAGCAVNNGQFLKERVMKNSLIICALIGLLFSPTIAVAAWTGNLLVNPGAETGTLDGWITDAPAVVIACQSQNETLGVVYPHSGDWFFTMCGAAAGPSGVTVSHILYQDVDLSSYASDTDAGLLLVKASMYLQTEDVPSFTGADYGQLTVYFLDEVGGEIDSLSTGLVQSPNLTWIEETLDGTAPVGTRSIRFELLGEKYETKFINAFFDDANFQVMVVPEPATLCLLMAGAAIALRSRRRM